MLASAMLLQMVAVFIAAYGRRKFGSRRASLEKLAAVCSAALCGPDVAAEGLQMKFARRVKMY